MRSPFKIQGSLEREIYLVSPHQFFIDRQQQFLTGWDLPASYLVLVLQRSQVDFKTMNRQVIQAKDKLRANFIRLGCNLIFALLDKGYQSDLFDPRTGYPLLSQPGALTFDDNTAIATLLNYPVVSYQNCSLLTHPQWDYNFYPSTIVTSAPKDIVEKAIALSFPCQP